MNIISYSLKLFLFLLLTASVFSFGLFMDDYILAKWLFSAVFGICVLILLPYCTAKDNCKFAEFHKLFSCLMILILSVMTVLCIVNSIADYSCISEGRAIASFDNAAGAASCMCIALPFALYYDNGKLTDVCRKIIVPLLAVAVCVLQSRTGILCIGVLLLFFYFKRKHYDGNKSFPILIIFIGLAVLLFLSPDSTKGRAFILLNTLTMLTEHPLGLGFGGFRREYMNYQADFFKSNPDSSFGILADNVRTPLNDILLFTVDYGILGLLIIVSLIALAIYLYRHCRSDRRYVYLSSLMAVGIFSLFSYPFSYPFTWIMTLAGIIALTADSDSNTVNSLKTGIYNLLGKNAFRIPFACVLIVILCLTLQKGYYERLWKAYDNEPALMSQEKKQEMESYFSSSPRFIAYTAIKNYEQNDFTGALRNIHLCENYWADYDLSLYEGMSLLKMRKFEDAVSAFEQAHYMCPNRFYPLYYQMKAYISLGNTKEAKKIAAEILNKPVKVYSQDVLSVRREAHDVLAGK